MRQHPSLRDSWRQKHSQMIMCSTHNLCRIYVESMSNGCRTPRVIPFVAHCMCPYVGHRMNTCTTVKFVLCCDCTNPQLPLARMRQLCRSHTPICAHMVIESDADAPSPSDLCTCGRSSGSDACLGVTPHRVGTSDERPTQEESAHTRQIELHIKNITGRP